MQKERAANSSDQVERMTKFKVRGHILRLMLAGGVASLLGLLMIALRAWFGAELALPVRVTLVPLELPFFFSFQLSQHLWNDPVNDLYNHVYFSMVAYFVAGLVIYGLFQVVNRKVLYCAAVVALAAVLVCGLIWRHQSRPAGHFDDFKVVQHGWARMPLWVKGNADTGIMLLFLHGGPGGNAIEKHLSGGFRRLEQEFAIVYWDQRASGNSTGTPADAVATVDDCVDDLRQVVRLCQQQYRPKALFLMGHSAGGELGTRYLIDAAGEGQVAGWIEVDGAHNEPLCWKLSIAWLKERAEQRIDRGGNQEERQIWDEAREYAAHHVRRENWYETQLWDKYIGPAGGYDFGQAPERTDFRGELHYLFSRQLPD